MIKQKFTYLAAVMFVVIGLCAPLLISGRAAAASSQFSGAALYVDSNGNFAATQAAAWRSTRPADAAIMDTIANQPKAYWMGNWTPNSQQSAGDYINRATAAGKLGMIVAYNIPGRDCGSYSAGGADSHASYRSWIDGMAAGINGRRSAVIVEPDALPQLDCLDSAGQQARLDSLSYAVTKLKSAGAAVYLDAGNKGWIGSAEIANRLSRANIAAADGFSLNVSNFYTSSETAVYGNDVSARTGGKHYIIDTSRNGLGANGEWCNPSGRALGTAPTSNTGSGLIDAYLWIKGPGESDGTCNGGPSAGSWWPEYALGLAQRAAPPATPTPPPTAPAPAPSSAPSKNSTSQSPAASPTPKQPAAASADKPSLTANTQGVFTIDTSSVRPGEKLSVLVDGKPIQGTAIDSRTLSNGSHVVTVQKTDKNGRTSSTHRTIQVANPPSLKQRIIDNLPAASVAFSSPLTTTAATAVMLLAISIPSYLLFSRRKLSS